MNHVTKCYTERRTFIDYLNETGHEVGTLNARVSVGQGHLQECNVWGEEKRIQSSGGEIRMTETIWKIQTYIGVSY